MPTIVRLGKGEVQSRVVAELVDILPCVDSDPRLPPDSIEALLETTIHLLIRFHAWLVYPAALWQLSAKYNPGYVLAIRAFLQIDKEDLDKYSLGLQEAANAHRGDALDYMMSDAVQVEITGIVDEGSASSLDVERKHNVDKLVTKRTPIATVAGASAKSLIHTVRRQGGRRTREDMRRIKREKFMNYRALGIQKNPDLWQRPRGHLAWMGAEPAASASASAVVHKGDPAALEEWISEHKAAVDGDPIESHRFLSLGWADWPILSCVFASFRPS